MKQKIVYIMGLGHSGSTLLQMHLSAHRDIIGMGEIGLLIKSINSKNQELPQCSCGETPEKCEVWGEIIKIIKNEMPDEEKFKIILQHFNQKYPEKVIIDSSKNLENFKKYYSKIDQEKIDLKVIYLVRDFRSWIISRKKNNSRKKRKDYGPIYNAYKWYYRNIRKLNYLKESRLNFCLVNYEDFVFQSKKTTGNIFNFLGLNDEAIELQNICTHDIYGNRMKNDLSKSREMIYDHRWMKDNTTLILSPFLILPISLNKKLYNIKG